MNTRCILAAVLALLHLTATAGEEQPWLDIGWGSGDRYDESRYIGTLDGRAMHAPVSASPQDQHRMGLSKNAVYSLGTTGGDADRIWAMTPDGLYWTEDRGQTWTYIDASSPRALNMRMSHADAVRPVAVDPGNSATVFVGTDDGRLYRTADAGASWTQCRYAPVAAGRMAWRQGAISSVTIARDDPSSMVVTNTAEGAFRSDDGGLTWRRLGDLPHPLHVSFHPGKPATLWASCAESGLWRSDDGGASFARVKLHTADPYIRETAIPSKPSNNVYAIGSIADEGILFRSADGGTTWTGNRTLIRNEGMRSLSTIAILPSSPMDIVLTSNWNIYMSRDGGETIHPCYTGNSRPYVADMLMHNGRLHAVTCGSGLFQSASGNAFWRQLINPAVNQALDIYMCRIGVVEYNGETCLLATATERDGKGAPAVYILGEDGRIIERTSEGLPSNPDTRGALWGGCFPCALAVSRSDPRVVYLGLSGEDGGLFRSDNGGHSWRKTGGQPRNLMIGKGLAVDPRDSSRVYWGTWGTDGVYLSADAGGTWDKVLEVDDVISMVTSASGVVYVGATDLHCSRDAGRTWKKLSAFSKESKVMSIATDPRDDNRIWITQNDHLDKQQWTHIWQSSDRGATWQEITRNFQCSNGLELCYDPREDTLYGGLFSIHKLPLGRTAAGMSASGAAASGNAF